MPFLKRPTASAFVAAAASYIGVPFAHQGRSRAGVDCLGLVVLAARDVGIAVRDNLNYGARPNYETMRAGLAEHCAFIPKTALEIGDLLWIRWVRGADPMHLIIIEADGVGLHATRRAGRVDRVAIDRRIVNNAHTALRWHNWVS